MFSQSGILQAWNLKEREITMGDTGAQSAIDTVERGASGGAVARGLDQLAQFWSVRVPRWLDPWAPRVADAFADGAWTATWSRGSWVIALLPVVALVVGVFVPLSPSLLRYVYTESLFFMLLVVAGAILSGPAGVMLFAGYVLRMVLWGAPARYSFIDSPLGRGGGLLISYLLLAILAFRIPLLARRMAEEVPLPTNASVRFALRVMLFASSCALLVFVWCQAMIALIRPVFTWTGDRPPVEAIIQVQQHWGWMVTVAATAAVARMLLEHMAVSQSPRAKLITDLQSRRWADPQRHGEWWRRRVPNRFRAVLIAALTTLLLAGLYESWLDAFFVGLGAAGLAAWRFGLAGRLPSWWTNFVNRSPAVLRYVAALLIGYLMAYRIISALWSMGNRNFRSVVVAAFITLAMFYVFFPRPYLGRSGEDGIQ